MGGAALTWALANHAASRQLKPTKRKRGLPIVLNDVNPELSNTYRVVRDQIDNLIDAITELARDTSEDAYYRVRESTPGSSVDAAARTIFLNRLGFNGLYRVRADGKFNVPYGRIARPVVCDEPLLRACSAWLQFAEIRTGSYTSAVEDAKRGDIVYFDPPYIPLNTTASFSKYAKDDFREMDHWGLAGVIEGLTNRGVNVLLSNSDTPLTRQIFGSAITLRTISASRSIAASGSSRGRVNEVLGINYRSTEAADPAVLDRLPRAGAPNPLVNRVCRPEAAGPP